MKNGNLKYNFMFEKHLFDVFQNEMADRNCSQLIFNLDLFVCSGIVIFRFTDVLIGQDRVDCL